MMRSGSAYSTFGSLAAMSRASRFRFRERQPAIDAAAPATPSAVVRTRFIATPKRAAEMSAPRTCVACAAAVAGTVAVLDDDAVGEPRVGGLAASGAQQHEPTAKHGGACLPVS